MGIKDQRLWRIIEHYVFQAVARLDHVRRKLLFGFACDGVFFWTQRNVTVFIDLNSKQKPVESLSRAGKGKATFRQKPLKAISWSNMEADVGRHLRPGLRHE